MIEKQVSEYRIYLFILSQYWIHFSCIESLVQGFVGHVFLVSCLTDTCEGVHSQGCYLQKDS